MFNQERFDELFGCYNAQLQQFILKKLYDSKEIEVLGLSEAESQALRDYLGVTVDKKVDVKVNNDAEIPSMAKVSRKAMFGVMRQSHLLEIAEAEKQLAKLININSRKKLQQVSSYTTGELMNMYGVAAYPLIRLCKKKGIYPLPDLAPNGAIRPLYSVDEANFSVRLTNAIKKYTKNTDKSSYYRYGSLFNLAYLIVEDESTVSKIRGLGKNCLEEIQKLREEIKEDFPEYYERLIQLVPRETVDDNGNRLYYGNERSREDFEKFRKGHGMPYYLYYESGSKEEFEAFKKECELRKLINFDEEECLKRIEGFTVSELRSMFGDLFGVLEEKCKFLGIYPLPEVDSMGNVTPSYLLGSGHYDGFNSLKENVGVKYAHELFALNDEELQGVLDKCWNRQDAEDFIRRVKSRYPEHIERIKEIRKTKESKKTYV